MTTYNLDDHVCKIKYIIWQWNEGVLKQGINIKTRHRVGQDRNCHRKSCLMVGHCQHSFQALY